MKWFKYGEKLVLVREIPNITGKEGREAREVVDALTIAIIKPIGESGYRLRVLGGPSKEARTVPHLSLWLRDRIGSPRVGDRLALGIA